ncbi:REP element-mobilizing transposase RayT [Winogradskyella pacifica]|uniref:REP element-mobilizing transposase RayT n=2 Tax=Winogradskyella pacifica TaxID=664642 RepID=A0A3D9N149_9FLAO|nr:REP element-mobilizing transposase RayT [Winogradskyella pacifica]
MFMTVVNSILNVFYKLQFIMILKPLIIDDCPQFFTATILDWKKLLQPEKYKLIIIQSLQYLVNEKRVIVYGYVIMDNHIHLIWKPTQLYSLKHTQLSFMKFTAQRIKQDLELNHCAVLKHFLVESKDRMYQFWKRSSLCINLYSNDIIAQKLNYIHQNPVKAGLCNYPENYRFSSAKFYNEEKDDFSFVTDFRI